MRRARWGDNPVLVMPHRRNMRWECRRWRFTCDMCPGKSHCYWWAPGPAADHARLHLLAIHGYSRAAAAAARAGRTT